MARLNDNLFTRLVEYSVPQEVGCHLLTRWGFVSVSFANEGLASLEFEESGADPLPTTDNVFHDAFLAWLERFQVLPASEQWTYLAVKGTSFQKSVWQALLEVPKGQTTSYGAIAEAIKHPKAHRAVGSAVGANPISLLIPCHRIVRSDGTLGNYRWGIDRKQALLDAEQKTGSHLLDLFL